MKRHLSVPLFLSIASSWLEARAQPASLVGAFMPMHAGGRTSVRNLAPLTAEFTPALRKQPLSLTVSEGGTAVLSVEAIGLPPLTYQWRKDGVPVLDGAGTAGARSSTLNLTAVTSTQAGSYSVIVSNLVGFVSSSAGVLTVLSPLSIETHKPPATRFFRVVER